MNMVATFPAMPEHIPQGAIIGQRFRIDEVIAEGGMGVVYKGWHLVLEHPIAVKVMRSEYARHPPAVARFLNEARASAQLQGVHMTRVLDIGRIENGPPFMVLEYLEGQDLRTVLNKEGPLPLDRAVKYVIQACEAVSEAHARGIVHRDLKPENLFATQSSEGKEILKVIDFGISKRLDSNSRSFTIENQSLGSPQYMAPEQMSTPSQVDARADIWSLGVVLFELLTKSVPFSGETFQVICVKVLRDEPETLRTLRPDLPAELQTIVAQCLQKNPKNRYNSVADLARELEPFATPTPPMRPSTIGRRPRHLPPASTINVNERRTVADEGLSSHRRWWRVSMLTLSLACLLMVHHPQARAVRDALVHASSEVTLATRRAYQRLMAIPQSFTQDQSEQPGR